MSCVATAFSGHTLTSAAKLYGQFFSFYDSVPFFLQGGHFVFMDNPELFHAAVIHACRKYFATKPGDPEIDLPEGLIIPPRLGTESAADGSVPNVRS